MFNKSRMILMAGLLVVSSAGLAQGASSYSTGGDDAMAAAPSYLNSVSAKSNDQTSPSGKSKSSVKCNAQEKKHVS